MQSLHIGRLTRTLSFLVKCSYSLQELDNPEIHYYFVKKLISLSMDASNRQREMASTFLSNSYAKVGNGRTTVSCSETALVEEHSPFNQHP